MRKKISRILLQLVIAFVVAVAFWSIMIMLFEERFIYFPTKYPDGRYGEAVNFQNLTDCWIKTEDNLTIHGWYASSENAIATIIMSHGNAGNISHRIDIMRLLVRYGFNVMMYDYRGYGRSEGEPNEEGIYSDGKAVFDYVKKMRMNNKIILWGTSLGGAVAVDVASNRQAAGLILESAFTSARDMARIHYPYIPVSNFLTSKLNSINKISKINIPTLIIHGEKDKIVPIELGEKLFFAANEPKEFYVIKNADHNDTYFVGGSEYFDRIYKFVSNIK